MHYYITLLRLLFTLFLFQLQSKPILLPADKRAPWKWLAGSRSQLKYRNPPERTRIANRFSNKLTASCGRNSRTLVWCQQCPGGIPKCQIYCNLSPQQKKKTWTSCRPKQGSILIITLSLYRLTSAVRLQTLAGRNVIVPRSLTNKSPRQEMHASLFKAINFQPSNSPHFVQNSPNS